jgi:hypothetical protein
MHSLYYLKNHAIGFIELGLAAGIVYLIALYAFTRTPATRTTTILLIFGAIVFRATLWPMLPTLSDDLQRYRWEGKVQAEGWNPYGIAPNDPRLANLRDYNYEIMPGRELPAIYPPATELLFRATWKWFPGPTEFKAPFAAADVMVLLLLAWMFWGAEDRDFRVAIYGWNPLVIVEFAGSGHNDVLAVLGIVCGLALVKKWPAIANVPVSLAAMAKVFPAVLLPVWIRRAGWPGKRGWWAAALAALAALAVLAPYWNVSGEPQLLRSDLEKLSRKFVYADRLDDRRKNENPGAGGGAGELGTGVLVGVEENAAGLGGLSAAWNDSGVRAEWLFLVFHVDCAAAVFFSESGVADAYGAAIFVLQRFDWLWDLGRFSL